MTEGDIVLVPLPQADDRVKNRPALVLRKMPPYDDLLVCGISKQLHREVEGFDDTLKENDADFAESGLRSLSLIRLSFLALLPKRSVVGSIGSVDAQRHRKLLQRLADYLTQTPA